MRDYNFMKISEISLDTQILDSPLAITLDFDWACDEIILDTIDLLKNTNISVLL